MAAPNQQQNAVEAIAQRIADAAGIYLEEVQVRRAGRRLLVQVVVSSESGLNLDELAAISRDVDRDIEDAGALGDAAYTLEVTTRGLDQPLLLPRHFAANRGRLVKVQPKSGDGYVERLTGVSADQLTFETGRVQALVDVESAFVELEFNRKDVEPIAFDVAGEEQ